MYNYNPSTSSMIKGNKADDDEDFITSTLSDLTGIDFGKIKDMITSVTSIFKEREFTIGKYKLAEKYSKYQLGNDPGSWQAMVDHPELVNQAIDFYSRKFGVPITTIEDLDNLDPSYDTSGNNVRDYKARDPLYAKIPDALVQQAVKIKAQLPYSMPSWDFTAAYQRAGITSGSSSTGGILSDTEDKLDKATGGHGKIALYIILGIIGVVIIIVIVKLLRKK